MQVSNRLRELLDTKPYKPRVDHVHRRHGTSVCFVGTMYLAAQHCNLRAGMLQQVLATSAATSTLVQMLRDDALPGRKGAGTTETALHSAVFTFSVYSGEQRCQHVRDAATCGNVVICTQDLS